MGIDTEQILRYWGSEADEALEVAEHLLEKEDFGKNALKHIPKSK